MSPSHSLLTTGCSPPLHPSIATLTMDPKNCAPCRFLQEHEDFDRGFYAGPFGWISGCGSEFVVAIRSALILPPTSASSTTTNTTTSSASSQTAHHSSSAATHHHTSTSAASSVDDASKQHHSDSGSVGQGGQAGKQSQLTTRSAQQPTSGESRRVMLYAGVGVVTGSNIRSEWQELDLKIRQFQSLLQPLQPLSSAPNMNAAWARMLVEELCRQGVSMFCVAPGGCWILNLVPSFKRPTREGTCLNIPSRAGHLPVLNGSLASDMCVCVSDRFSGFKIRFVQKGHAKGMPMTTYKQFCPMSWNYPRLLGCLTSCFCYGEAVT